MERYTCIRGYATALLFMLLGYLLRWRDHYPLWLAGFRPLTRFTICP